MQPQMQDNGETEPPLYIKITMLFSFYCFPRHWYFYYRKLFSKEEVDLLSKALVDNPILDKAWEVSVWNCRLESEERQLLILGDAVLFESP